MRLGPLFLTTLIIFTYSGLFILSLQLKLPDPFVSKYHSRKEERGSPTDVLVITTAASSEFFEGLLNLIGSILFFCPNDCLIAVFAMNLNDDQIRILSGKTNTVLYWNNKVVSNPSNYAFKPLAIQEVLESYPATLWLDAGSTVTGDVYNAVMPILKTEKHFFVQGQDVDASQWVHDGMLIYYQVNRSFFNKKPSFSGNTIGFTKGHPALKLWVECAERLECFAPEGSSRQNHRYDQAAITVILYTLFPKVQAHTELLAYSKTQLRECFQKNDMVIWTSRSSEKCYKVKG